MAVKRSTKAGASTPATPAAQPTPARPIVPAQRRPGRQPRRHTVTASQTPLNTWHAQRRPGRQPRRHFPNRHLMSSGWHHAQRRPGRQPRRHPRSLKPPPPPRRLAQRRPGRQPRRHHHRPRTRPASQSPALNEGRGVNPGDTSRSTPRCLGLAWMRSTKAGASTPATPPARRTGARRA